MITRSTRRLRIQLSTGDRVFYFLVNLFALFMFVVVLYPLIYVVSSSFSSPDAVLSGKVVFLPVEFSLEGYKTVFGYQDVLTGYMNTILYTVLGTTINIIMTLICAYPLARKTLPFRNFFMFLFTFTMFFSGGMIPTYILVSKLGLRNTIWSMILPSAVSVYNLILVRTYIMRSISEEIMDAARIDGCGDWRLFLSVVLPLSAPIMATMALFYGVGHWNQFFAALIYISDQDLYPLQLVLRNLLLAGQNAMTDMISGGASGMDPQYIADLMQRAEILKYAVIIVATVPILAVYPFLQKYFVKGIMAGSLKG